MNANPSPQPCPRPAGSNDREWRLALDSPGDTAALAARVGELSGAGDVIALWGDLGAGKTAFARGLIRARLPDEEVPSPTFTLVQIYESAAFAPVWHFDLYRLTGADEVWELGFEDALEGAVSLIEWPERLGRGLPLRRLDVELAFDPAAGPTVRAARLIGRGPDWARRVERLETEDAGE
jgi:tRNA threonylcarbamoyl adenosine modification protein YjeE